LGAKEKGIPIPGQLSLVGFDDTILARATYPCLTTVVQPISELGNSAVDLLIDKIQTGRFQSQRILYNPELIIRETTGKIPAM
jgi:DNA-binding LacI/PurR family transcriptional regulator